MKFATSHLFFHVSKEFAQHCGLFSN